MVRFGLRLPCINWTLSKIEFGEIGNLAENSRGEKHRQMPKCLHDKCPHRILRSKIISIKIIKTSGAGEHLQILVLPKKIFYTFWISNFSINSSQKYYSLLKRSGFFHNINYIRINEVINMIVTMKTLQCDNYYIFDKIHFLSNLKEKYCSK